MNQVVEFIGELDEEEEQEEIKEQQNQVQTINQLQSIKELQLFLLNSEKDQINTLLQKSELLLQGQNQQFAKIENRKEQQEIEYIRKMFRQIPAYLIKLNTIRDKKIQIMKTVDEIKKQKQKK